MITDQKLEEFRAQHPRGVFVYTLTDGEQWAFRKPTADEWRACKGALNIGLATGDAQAVSAAHERLAHACCVFPSSDAFQVLRDEEPAIAGGFGERLFATVGKGRSIVEGKAGSSPATP